MKLILDHLVIGADSLEQGIAYVQEKLGIDIPPGGKHPLMGTHNHLTRIGEGIFLEVIAIDPHAPTPSRPRWFSLDEIDLQKKLKARPQLITWVLGTMNIQETLHQSPLDLGKATELSRGELHWLISLRSDGALVEHGLMPILIQWPDIAHPANRMQDLGLRLETIRLIHPQPDTLKNYLERIQADHLVEIHLGKQAKIEADFRNQQGELLSLT